uniref:5'-3' DNA helicase ZGRF1-like N-terminal domain-containing protein n=1 Tax=Pseudonaja textilis TaxID=8673 RepID=A0A670ZRG6_PSETE
MAYQEFIVLYTHQKTKKSKVWQDGILKAAFGGNKVGSVCRFSLVYSVSSFISVNPFISVLKEIPTIFYCSCLIQANLFDDKGQLLDSIFIKFQVCAFVFICLVQIILNS